MADVGLGQLVTLTGRHRSKKLRDAITDSHPFMAMLKKEKGIRRIDGGRSIVEEGLTGQNTTVKWMGPAEQISLADQKVADAAEFEWKYIGGSVVWTLAERLQNGGGSDTKYIDLVDTKFSALEASMKNKFEAGLISNGTANGGLQIGGIAALVSTTPSTGTVGGIDRSNSNAAWYRNQKFDTATDWAEGAVTSANITRFLDKLLNLTTRDGKPQPSVLFLGEDHWSYAQQAIQARQFIMGNPEKGNLGFDVIMYRGVPLMGGFGINYSGESQISDTRTYGLNFKPGGVNLVFHEDAEFKMLSPVDSADQAAVSRLMFTMANMTLGALAKTNIVGFD